MALASSIYHNHEVSIEKYLNIYAFDPDYAVKDSVVLSDRLPGTAFSIIPFLIYADAWSFIYPESKSRLKYTNQRKGYYVTVATLLPNICGVLSLFCFFIMAYKVFNISFISSFLSMMIVGLATLMSLESIHLFSHALSMLLITLSVLIVLYKSSTLTFKRRIYILSAIIGFSSIVELQNILLLAPFFIYLIIKYKKEILSRKKESRRLLFSSLAILLTFLSILLAYNYIAFNEILLKSNKYNPFFPEEGAFLSALSGNFLEGIDNLFTSFNNISSYYNWESGVRNSTPGILVSNPVFIISIIGYFIFFKHHRDEAILFFSIIMISVLIAALHVTTLIRHIYSIHMLLFFPFVFVLEYIYLRRLKTLALLVLLLTVFSLSRQVYIANHYWSRDYTFFQFPNIDMGNIPLFLQLNIPLWIYFSYLSFKFLIKKESIRRSPFNIARKDT